MNVGSGARAVDDGAWLAEYIRSPDRVLPVVVVSVHPERPQGCIDAEAIAREVDGLAEVFVITNGPATRAFQAALPPGREVYGNAVRAYSTKLDWLEDMYRSPLHLANDPARARQSVRDVVHDVVSMAPRPSSTTSSSVPERVAAAGRVTGFAAEGHRAIVELGTGGKALISPESAIEGIRLDWVLRVGQDVEGFLNPAASSLDITDMRIRPRLIDYCAPEQQVLALVVDVKPRRAKLRLFPDSDWPVELSDVTSNPLDTMDGLLSEGEVVVARFTREHGAVRLSLIDVDEDAPVVPAPLLIRGGAPWLVRDRDLLSVRRLVDAVGEDHPTASTTRPGGETLRAALLELDAARAENALLKAARDGTKPGEGEEDAVRILRAQLAEANSRLASAGAALHQSSVKVAQLTLDLSKARADAARHRKTARDRERQFRVPTRDSFANDTAWARHELYEAWVRVVPPGDKERWPFPAWEAFSIGTGFAASLQHSHVAVRLGRAFDMCLRTIIGDPILTAPLEAHRLRAGAGAEDARVVRPDGAEAWRASVQRNTPAALRLHYWRLPNGRIELDSIHPHDDGL